ncbi:MAG TPA: alpha/beta fold hydrolase [Phycisphaerae bacterium]|nr:alpha/beta fold hydrolase [Phycisphaerae bacterium]HRR84868.1 alpha/beta fold hydrolase [Phycisphaerae bacterium]
MWTFMCRRAGRAFAAVGGMGVLMAANLGCFPEKSFKMDPEASVRVSERLVNGEDGASTRVWLRRTQRELAGLLPDSVASPLLTEELVNGDGRAVDVLRHFGVSRQSLQSIVKNYRGIRYSAQAASRDYCIEKQAAAWPGFEDVWIPMRLAVDDQLELSGRLGYARNGNGEIIEADCVVILPGLFGDHGVKRSRDLAIPLRESGFHVLHLELRGHGQTESRYPRMYHTFGVMETDDLMQVSDYLEQLPHIRRTGLIAYCWNASIALLAAWYDGRLPDDPQISPAIRPYLQCPPEPLRRRFSAGIIAFSPVVRWEVLMDELDRQRSIWAHPIYAAIQDTIRDRMVRKGYPERSGSLRNLIEYEHNGYGIPMPHGAREGYPFLRLISYNGEPSGDKLEFARMPVLIVHGADDPLVPAQDVADLMATVDNPRVGAIILPSGGHVGFAAYCPRYYLSLITNFFDPVNGPAGRGAAISAAAR